MLIRAQRLSKRFGRTVAIDGLDLAVDAGRPVGLVGPNGAGKTTLFSLIAGFLQPSSGSLEVLGHIPGDAALRGQVAILPQDARFQERVPLQRQLRLLARLQGLSRPAAQAEVARVLDMLAITELGDRAPHTLSHGQLKRALIAQTLLGKPRIVLLDEPTAGLDPASVQVIRRLVKRQESEVSFLISSHNLDEIEDLCGSVTVMERGRLVTHDAMDALVQRGRRLTFRLAREASPEERERLQAVAGVEHVESGAEGERLLIIHYRAGNGELEIEILRAMAAAGLEFLEMNRGDSLSRRFSELTGP